MLQAQVATDDSTADEFAVGDTTTEISEPRPRFESTRQSAEDIGLSITVDEVQDGADSVGDASFELDMTLPMVPQQEQVSMNVDVVEEDDVADVSPADTQPQFRIAEGASQRGRDLLVESVTFTYNIAKRCV